MRSAALTFALLIILSGVAPAAAMVQTGVDGGQEPVGAVGLTPQSGLAQVDSDTSEPATEIRVQLEADTDARWAITYRYALTDEDEVAGFRDLGAEYEAGRTDIGIDAALFRSVARQVSTTTDRDMQIRDVERTARVERPANATTSANGTVNATGTLTLSFTWTNFLEEQENGALVLGDAFSTGNGETWLSSLGTDQRLTIVTPPGYVISRTSFPVQTQNGSLIIDGPREFESGERLSVTYVESATTELPETLLIGGGIGVVVVLVLVYYVAARRGRSRETDTPASDQAVTNGGGSESTSDDTAGKTGPTPTPGPRPGDDATATRTDDGSDALSDDEAGDETVDDEPDFELLSDEERVEYLLEKRGGRMKQANIVKETGWSDAKVSQLLSAMAENGRVEKLRLGRENLISLPESDETDEDAG